MAIHPVILLSLATLVIVLAGAIWQFSAIRRSQRRRGEEPGSVKTVPNRPKGALATRERESVDAGGGSPDL